MLYFAYGSNMSTQRIGERLDSVTVIGVGRVQEHQLKFHKRSARDGSAKCDIWHNGEPSSEVYGVLFDIAENEKIRLDNIEGLGYGYGQKEVEVYMSDQKMFSAVTYYATDVNPILKPYSWYREHVVRGAREHNLPKEYIQAIERVEVVTDPDKKRETRELSIYRDL